MGEGGLLSKQGKENVTQDNPVLSFKMKNVNQFLSCNQITGQLLSLGSCCWLVYCVKYPVDFLSIKLTIDKLKS